jgi:hypothetical protein
MKLPGGDVVTSPRALTSPSAHAGRTNLPAGAVQYEKPIRALVAIEGKGSVVSDATVVDSCGSLDHPFRAGLAKCVAVDVAALSATTGGPAGGLIAD